MKKAILLLGGLAVGAGGGYVARGLQEGKGISEGYAVREMSGEA